MAPRYCFIVNDGAAGGGGRACWEALQPAVLARLGEATTVVTAQPGDAAARAREADGQQEIVVAVGGDGTVNEVANGMLQPGAARSVLGVVPVGTGNDIAQHLGLTSPAAALEALAAGHTTCVDVVEVSFHREGQRLSRYGLSYAAVGFASELLRQTTPAIKRCCGARFAYCLVFLRALRRFRSLPMRVTCDDQRFAGDFFLVAAGNTPVVGGGTMRLFPGATMTDGWLHVNVVQALGRWEALRSFRHLLKGTHTTLPLVRYLSAKSVEVEALPVVEVQIDGDVHGHAPARMRVRPGALRVVTPPPTGGT